MSYATNEVYSAEKVMELINSYPYYIKRITALRKEYQDEVGGGNIGQYGIEATLPKPQGGSTDPVFNEMQRLMKMDQELSRLESKTRYIQNRWNRITDERLATILNLRLSGYIYKEIADRVGLSEARVNQLIKEICKEFTY